MAKLSVSVYRWNLGDCTADGVTSKVDSIMLFDNQKEALEYEKETGKRALYLENRKLSWHKEPYKTAYPASGLHRNSVGWMMGGNFVYCSHSGFSEIFGTSYPIPVHDRQESQEVYDALSR